jgi:predicted short-subunit dehydrogenase-like oxidoreductase (DUF2520 family)
MVPAKPEITIIGLGRLGSALLRALDLAGYPIASVVSGKNTLNKSLPSSVKQHSARIANLKVIGDICFICTPDDAIASVATELSHTLQLSGTTVVHVSGAKVSDELIALEGLCAGIASFHPIQTFKPGSEPAVFKNISVSLEGDKHAVDILIPIVQALGANHLILNASDKTRIHVAAVFVSNFMSSLFLIADDILKESQVKSTSASSEIFATICRQTLENILTDGLPAAITGPASRGDVQTLIKHLDMLDSLEYKQIYRLLSKRITTEFYEKNHPVCVFLQQSE